MLKIAVFGFYGPDQARILRRDESDHLSPVNTSEFMREVWRIEPQSREMPDSPCFVKLTGIASQPVYVQSLSNRMAPGAGLLNCDGYIAIIDAVKILAPKTIQNALRRLADTQARAHLIVAAGRQNEPDALSSDEIREVLGLHPDQPIYPYVPSQPKTVHRLIRRLARYLDDQNRAIPPIFAGDTAKVPAESVPVSVQAERAAPAPRFLGLGHISITVSDLERALDFYRGLLGFRVLGHYEVPGSERGLKITHLNTGRGVIELFSYKNFAVQSPVVEDDSRAGMQHFALRVSGLDAIAEQLACAGVPFSLEPEDFGGARIAFISDPDGTSIELIEGDLVFNHR
jgi:catechol 2,3-dioxygenase-like lactoylglutathione lyase family enzyme